MSKPLPCPFCGVDPVNIEMGEKLVMIFCANTECHVKPQYPPDHYHSFNEKEIIEAWNTRSSNE